MKFFLLAIGMTLLTDLHQLGSEPHVVEIDGPYEKIALTDSTTIEVYKGDSIIVVFTVCAPQCSSRARVYNKEWHLIAQPQPHFSSVFPLATIDKKTGRILWTDNDNWEY